MEPLSDGECEIRKRRNRSGDDIDGGLRFGTGVNFLFIVDSDKIITNRVGVGVLNWFNLSIFFGQIVSG